MSLVTYHKYLGVKVHFLNHICEFQRQGVLYSSHTIPDAQWFNSFLFVSFAPLFITDRRAELSPSPHHSIRVAFYQVSSLIIYKCTCTMILSFGSHIIIVEWVLTTESACTRTTVLKSWSVIEYRSGCPFLCRCAYPDNSPPGQFPTV